MALAVDLNASWADLAETSGAAGKVGSLLKHRTFGAAALPRFVPLVSQHALSFFFIAPSPTIGGLNDSKDGQSRPAVVVAPAPPPQPTPLPSFDDLPTRPPFKLFCSNLSFKASDIDSKCNARLLFLDRNVTISLMFISRTLL